MADRRHDLLKNPIKSNRGGYLRCPFQIDPTFAAMATRTVMKGSTSGEYAEATRRRLDGLDYNADTRGGQQGQADSDFALMEDGLIEGRPWLRAGVGAKQMNAKEKQEQQRLAEKIYGTKEADQEDDDGGDVGIHNGEEGNTVGSNEHRGANSSKRNGGGGRTDSVQAASRFGTSSGERTALRKLLKPSEQKQKNKMNSSSGSSAGNSLNHNNDREKRLRQQSESTSSGNSGQTSRHQERIEGEATDSDEDIQVTKSGSVSIKQARTEHSGTRPAAASSEVENRSLSNTHKHQKGHHQPSTNTTAKPAWNSSPASGAHKNASGSGGNGVNSSSNGGNGGGGGGNSNSQLGAPNAGSPASKGPLRTTPNTTSKDAAKNLKDMNPLKRFELMRQAALFGNKKKR